MIMLEEFHNGLRILRSIDAFELGNPPWYRDFVIDPYTFFIQCADETAELIWHVMLKRGVVKYGTDGKSG